MAYAIKSNEYFVMFIVGIFFTVSLFVFYFSTFVRRELALKGEKLMIKQTHPLGTKLIECTRDEVKLNVACSMETNGKASAWRLSVKAKGKKLTLVGNCKDQDLLKALKYKILKHNKAPENTEAL